MSAEPSTTNLRELKRRRTKESIVQAAIRLFDERGYEDVTVAEIAAAAEVGQRTLYRYFADKEDFLFSTDTELHDTIARAARELPEETAALSVIIQAAAAGATLIQNQRAELVSRARIIARTPALQAREGLKQAALQDLFAHELIRRGHSPDKARLAAGIGSALIEEGLTRWLQGSSDMSLSQAIDGVQADLEILRQ